GATRALVITERHGAWDKPVLLSGPGVTGPHTDTEITTISCAAAGDCAAGGYDVSRKGPQAFVVDQRHGVWTGGQQVSGTGRLNVGGYAETTSVSCAAPGNCTAGGFVSGRGGETLAFVAGERNGRWRR